MNNFSSFSPLHPSWDGRDYTKKEYKEMLENLAKKKPSDALLLDSDSLRIAGTAMQIWQKIKGFLGFEDLTNPIKVNYELLKLLRYGEVHHFLSDAHIQNILESLTKSLEEDENQTFQKITPIIKQTFASKNNLQTTLIINSAITRFYSENQEHLHEAFWPNLFHKYITPMHQDTAQLHFNQAGIHLEDEKWEAAIQQLERGLKIAPNKPFWQWTLAKTLYAYGSDLHPKEASKLYERALTLLPTLFKNDDIPQDELQALYTNLTAASKTILPSKNLTAEDNDSEDSSIDDHANADDAELSENTFTFNQSHEEDIDSSVSPMLVEKEKIDQHFDNKQEDYVIIESSSEETPLIPPQKSPLTTDEDVDDVDYSEDHHANADDAELAENTSTFNQGHEEKVDQHSSDVAKQTSLDVIENDNVSFESTFEEIPVNPSQKSSITADEDADDTIDSEKDHANADDAELSENTFTSSDQEHEGDIDASVSAEPLPPQTEPSLILPQTEPSLNLLEEEQVETRTPLEIALDEAKIHVANNPEDWRHHLHISELYRSLSNYSAALEHLELAKKISPTQEVLSAIGNLHYENGKYFLALSAYQQANLLSPLFLEKVVDCHLALADEAFMAGAHHEMLNHYKQILSLDPSKAPEITKKIIAIGNDLQHENPAMAVRAYKMMIPFFDDGFIAEEHLINIYITLAEQEDVRTAIHYLEKARALDLHNPLISQKLVDNYMKIGNSEAAEKLLKQVADLKEREDSKKSLAYLYLSQDKFAEALKLFQELGAVKRNKTSYHKEITECLIRLAAKNELKNPKKALEYYQNALDVCTNEDKQIIASKLLNLGDAFLKSGNNTLALKSFSNALNSAPHIDELSQLQVFTAYNLLARADLKNNDYPAARANLQKALDLQPNNLTLILECAELDFSQGYLEKAAIGYRKATILDPKTPSYKQNLINLEKEIADKYYQKGILSPERAHQSILDLVKLATSPPFGEDIQNALGFWRGASSSLNKELTHKIGKNPQSLHAIEMDGNRACEIIETAYDDDWHHMSPTKMPSKISTAISQVHQEISNLREYYQTLQQRVEELMHVLLASPLSKKFSKWTRLPKMSSLNDAKAIEDHTKQTLQQVQNAVQQNPTAITPATQQQIDSLMLLSLPSGWMHLAINHYHNVFELDPTKYGVHLNRLIDAYIQVGEPSKAVSVYEELKRTFPNAPLSIDPTAYLDILEKPSKETKLTNQQMFEGLMRAGEQFGQEGDYEQAIHAYENALKVATHKQTQETALHLLVLGDRLVNNGQKAKAIPYYKSAFPYLKDLQLPPTRFAAILTELGYAATLEQDYATALNFYEKAAAAAPSEKLDAELGSLYLILQSFKKALSSYEKAAQANPTNKNYQIRLAEIETALGDKSYMQGLVYNLKKSLQESVTHVTSNAPYAKDIQSALGSGFGFLSAQNRKLRSLGTNARSPTAIQKDCQNAIELIQIAYDGKKNHKKPQEMPQELVERLAILQAQLNTLEEAIKELPQYTQKEFKNKKNLTTHSQQATAYYEKAKARFPDTFKDYYNRLIDSLVQQDESKKALTLYSYLKQNFPTSVLRINPLAYLQTIDAHIAEKDYKKAYELIATSMRDHHNSPLLKKRKSDLLFIVAEENSQKNDWNTAVRLYTLATKCDVDAKKQCYIQLARIYFRAMCKQIPIDFNVSNVPKVYGAINSPSFIDLNAFHEKEYKSHFQAAVANLRKAADLDPNDAELHFQLTRAVFHEPLESIDFDIMPYAKRATELDPKNVSYAYAYLKTAADKSTFSSSLSDPLVNELHTKFTKLGGSSIGDDQSYWNQSNPYGFAQAQL